MPSLRDEVAARMRAEIERTIADGTCLACLGNGAFANRDAERYPDGFIAHRNWKSSCLSCYGTGMRST